MKESRARESPALSDATLLLQHFPIGTVSSVLDRNLSLK